MRVEFIVSSESVVLTDYGTIIRGKTGILAPETTLETQRLGGILRMSAYRQERRPVDLPYFLEGDSPNEPDPVDVYGKARAILDVLRLGEGTLRVQRDDGVERELRSCYYRDGLREQNLPGDALRTVLSFDALDPYWYATADINVEYTNAGTPTPSFFPFFPLRLLYSQIVDSQIINNPGVECWPIWTITGPGSSLSLVNQTTGKTTIWTGTLTAADVLEIDTRPLFKTIRKNGANAWSNVPASTSELWSLATGDNSILVTMTDVTVETVARLTFTPRYISL